MLSDSDNSCCAMPYSSHVALMSSAGTPEWFLLYLGCRDSFGSFFKGINKSSPIINKEIAPVLSICTKSQTGWRIPAFSDFE